MIINSCGDGCFKIQTGGLSILTEDFSGETSSRFKADIFIRTNDNQTDFVSDNMILGPGEYEVKGVDITGYPDFAYLIKVEDMKIGFLTKPVDVDFISPDILFISNTSEGAKIIRQLNPKIVISQSGEADILEKELGKKAEVLDKLVIKKKEVPTEDIGKIICLKA